MTVTDHAPRETTGPYATAAHQYLDAGFAPLPLPYGQKKPVPDGWTGNDGAWPSYADVQTWVEDRGGSNIGLRLPLDVLGIDVDHYGTKPGGATLAALEAQYGPLPPTWRVTSRDDGQSGIRLYRIPVGLRWPGVLGSGIETLRYAHRYAVAWPSIHPDTGKPYRWVTPDGATSLTDIPTVDELPALPDTWVQTFTHGELATDQPRADLTDDATSTWLQKRGQGAPCRHMQRALERGRTDLLNATSRHDTTLQLTNRIIWLTGEGHTGGQAALAQAGFAFITAVGNDRSPAEATGEWDRMVSGAVRLAAASHPNRQPDPCDDPFNGLIPKEQPWNTTPPSTPTSPVLSSLVSPTPSNASQTSSPTQPSTNAPEQPGVIPNEVERTSWWPREALDDNAEPDPPPTHLTRDDGISLFYSGRINGLIGPSESGKTWVALHAVEQAVRTGQHATILDFEDTQNGVDSRLRALGLTPTQIRTQVAYVGPDEPLTSALFPTGRDLHEHLDTWTPGIIVLDGFNAAMTLHGLDLINNKDATLFAQHVLKPLTRTGACVIYVDHTVKDKENTSSGGIGAQAKRAMTTGCAIRVDVKKQFGKGQDGTLTLRVDKDRQGDVRGASLPSGENGHWAGTAHLTSNPDGSVTLVVESPGTRIEQQHAKPFRLTGTMQKISEQLETAAVPLSGANLERLVGGNSGRVREAIRTLRDEGYLTIEAGARGALMHTLVTPYRQRQDPQSDLYQGLEGLISDSPRPPRPTSSPPRPDDVSATSSTTPPPYGGVDEVSGARNDVTSSTPQRIVKRILDGTNEVMVNLDTGEISPIKDGA